MGFKERYERTVAEAAACCEACGRDPKSVVVVAVSKTVGADEVAEASRPARTTSARNRPDSLEGKRARFPQQTWHFIGNIQSRRIPDIVRDAALVHSLYQQRHVPKFDAAAAASGKVQDVLLEVNVSGEASKSGLAPSEVAGMLEYCAGFPHVRVRGRYDDGGRQGECATGSRMLRRSGAFARQSAAWARRGTGRRIR